MQARLDVERVGVQIGLPDKAGETLTVLDAPALLRRVAAGGPAPEESQTDGMSGTGNWPTAVKAVVLRSAATKTTGPVDLTPGAAVEIRQRWGRPDQVLPHRHVVPLDRRTAPRP